MKNYFLLIKTLFRQGYRFDKSNKRAKSNAVGLIVGLGMAGIVLVPMLFMQLLVMARVSVENNIEQYYLGTVFMAMQIFTLIFGTIMLINTLFFSKDNTFLATIPMKPSTIFFGKLTYVAFNELIYAGSLGMLAMIMLGVVGKFGVLYYVLGFIAVVIAPLLSLLATSILLFPVMKILSYVRRNTTLTTMLNLIMFVGGMAIYILFITKISTSMEGGAEAMAEAMLPMIKGMGGIFFNLALGKIVVGIGALTDFGIVVAIYAVGLFVAYILSRYIYKGSLNASVENGDGKIKAVEYQSSSLIKTLIARDLKEIRREPTMMFYMLSQVVMAPLMIFLIFGVMYKEMGLMDDAGSIMLNTIGVMFLVMFGCGTNAMACSSITRENRKYYIMKVIPVPYTIQIRAKVVVAYISGFVATLLSGIALMLSGMNVISCVGATVTSLILCYGFTCWQVRIDVSKPRLNWQTISEGVKNNRASVVPMFVSMAVALVVMAVVQAMDIFGGMFENYKILITLGGFTLLILASSVLTFFLKRGLNRNIDKLFDSIEG